ncbi:MAG TPA: right-handed parallel beta-helix repeat-containing protein [Pyrinomonadaceae bacterium]|jgi:parallel beta-helix repeat protein
MNELPRRKLLEIVAKHGRSIIENPRRLEGLLRDYCGEYRREISVLVMAVEEHAAADMLAASGGLPRKVLLARLAQRLCDNLALSEAAALWSIESWALALGIISEAGISPGKSNPETEISVSTQTASPALSTTRKAAATITSSPPKPSVNSFIVAANGGGNFRSIGEALEKAAPNSRLLVREGLYIESLVLDKNIEIIGDGAIEKIIIRSPVSSCLLMQTKKALVRGLTLQGQGRQNGQAFFAVSIPGGELILENCHISSDSLSGVAVFGAGANPLIKNCWIHDCADSGFYIFDNASPRIESCDVYQNANVSVAVTQGANPTIKSCRIFDGNNGGVVIWGNGAAGTIENCHIYGHRLANVGVREYANPTFRRCKIYGGQDTGVFVHQNGYGAFEECDIYRNAEAEVGISQNANSVFRRCAIHDGENSGVILQNQCRALIENCDIYDNRDSGVAIHNESAATIKQCNIHGNRKVAVKIKENSKARVENCDLRGNFLAAWETEYGITLEENNNREY